MQSANSNPATDLTLQALRDTATELGKVLSDKQLVELWNKAAKRENDMRMLRGATAIVGAIGITALNPLFSAVVIYGTATSLSLATLTALVGINEIYTAGKAEAAVVTDTARAINEQRLPHNLDVQIRAQRMIRNYSPTADNDNNHGVYPAAVRRVKQIATSFARIFSRYDV